MPAQRLAAPVPVGVLREQHLRQEEPHLLAAHRPALHLPALHPPVPHLALAPVVEVAEACPRSRRSI